MNQTQSERAFSDHSFDVLLFVEISALFEKLWCPNSLHNFLFLLIVEKLFASSGASKVIFRLSISFVSRRLHGQIKVLTQISCKQNFHSVLNSSYVMMTDSKLEKVFLKGKVSALL